MAKVTKPADVSAGQKISAALWNTLKNTIFDEFGHTGQTTGNIDNDNIKTAAGIDPAKIANGGLVSSGAGVQTVTKPTLFSSLVMGALIMDQTNGWRSAQAEIASGATTVAIADATKFVQFYHFPSTAAANADITTLTGGTVGQVIHIVVFNEDATENVTFVNDTGTLTTDSFKFKRGNDGIAPAGGTVRQNIGTFCLCDMDGSGVNAWWEI